MEEFKEKDFEELKQQIIDTKEGIITGNIKNINYEINLNKPLRVIFKEEKSTAEFYSGKLASSKIEVDKDEKRVHYRKKNALNVGINLLYTIDVVESEINNKKYISEKCTIKEQFDDSMIAKKSDKIIEDLLANNKDIKSENEGEFVKEPIENAEEFATLIHSEEELEKYLIEGSKTKLGNFPSGFYEDRHDLEFNKKNAVKEVSFDIYIEEANKKIEEYKIILKIIDKCISADISEDILIDERIVEEDQEEEDDDEIIYEESIDEEETEEDDEVENEAENETETEEVEETSGEKDISEIDISELIKELQEKKRNEEKEILRNAKVNKVKELMELNKKLDDELSVIENDKKEEGDN